MSNKFLENYTQFVDEVTSGASKNREDFLNRINELYDQGFDVSRALTGSIGVAAEGGELTEIVKKIIFQGKPFNEDNRFHMKRELGDILWYVANAAMALGYTMEELIEENVSKLESRYPGGKFDVHNSENRKEGDL